MTRGPARLPALECRTLLFDLRDLSSWVSQSLSALDSQRLIADNGVGSGRPDPNDGIAASAAIRVGLSALRRRSTHSL